MEQLATNEKNHSPKNSSSRDVDNRTTTDRRQIPSEGYVYLNMVGWYCRRAKVRRANDFDPQATKPL